MKRSRILITFFNLIFIFSLSSFAMAAGSLDTTFGSGGKVLTPFENLHAGYGSQLARQADGRIVMACVAGTSAYSNRRMCLARYNPDGTLDTAFGAGGKVVTDLPEGQDDFTRALAIQQDGKIVVVAELRSFNGEFYTSRAAILRYHANGTLDAGFDGDGIRVFSNPTSFTDVTIQPDGKIIATGSGIYATIVRFNADGSFDTSFDDDGIAETLIPADNTGYSVSNIALQPDGKMVVSGTIDFKTFYVFRQNSNGSLDFTFDGDGIATTSLQGTGTHGTNARDAELLVQPDGKILIAGQSATIAGNRHDIVMVRYNANGSPDTSFDGDGKVFTHVSSNDCDDEGYDAVLQPDGKILVLANLNQVPLAFPPQALLGILRYNPDGSLDTTFGGGDGVVTTTATGVEDIAGSLLLLPNGKLMVTGRTGSNPSVFALLRFNTKSNTPFDFDGDSRTDISIYRPSLGEWWYLRSSNGSNYAAQFGASTDRLAPGDWTGDGKTDIAFWRPSSGEWFVLRSEDSSFYSFPFGINGDIPAPADYDGDGKTDAAIFRPSNANWYIFHSSGGFTIRQFGASGDVPVAADYDGDGKADIAIYRAASGDWWMIRSSDNVVRAFQFGSATDKPVPGDYTGDGKTDIAFWRPWNGFWVIMRSEDFSYYGIPFGTNGDIPAPGDYDGDGKFDAAVFRPSGNTWYVNKSTGGALIQNFGQTGDVPVPSAFIP